MKLKDKKQKFLDVYVSK